MAERVALVTSGTGGIGRAVLARLAANHRCVVHYGRDPTRAQDAMAELAWYGVDGVAVQGDLSTVAGIDAAATAALDAFGRIDSLVVDGAALASRRSTTAGRHQAGATMEGFVECFAHLVRRCTLAMAPGGRVVSVGSLDLGPDPSGPSASGAAGRAALEALTRSLAVELGPVGVTVNCVIAGAVDSESLRRYVGAREDLIRLLVDETPMGRLGRPEDVAAIVAFLCSPEAEFVTGQSIVVDGGLSTLGSVWGPAPSSWQAFSSANDT